MASGFYNHFYNKLFKGEFDFEAASGQVFKVMLLTNVYTFDETSRDTDEFISDVNANEVAGTGYSAGGATIGSVDITKNDTTNKSIVDGADVSWPSSTITARYGIIYKDTGLASTSPVIRAIDFSSDQASSNTEFKITWSANGIIDLTEA